MSGRSLGDGIARLRGSPLAAHTVPFVAFLLILEAIGWFRIENSALPWWRHSPEHWGYPLQTLACLALVWFWRSHYPPVCRRGIALGVLMGVAGIALWLAPPVVHAWTGIGDTVSWLQALGFRDRLEGFDPTLFGASDNPLVFVTVVAFRFLRMVVAVALVEEIFWRGFLMRYLHPDARPWEEQPVGLYAPLSFWLTTVFFASAHFGPDTVPALLYGALAGWVTIRTRNLWAVVLMHAVANLCLGLFILATGWWGLW